MLTGVWLQQLLAASCLVSQALRLSVQAARRQLLPGGPCPSGPPSLARAPNYQLTYRCTLSCAPTHTCAQLARRGGLRSTLLYNMVGGGEWDVLVMNALIGMGPGGVPVSMSLLQQEEPDPVAAAAAARAMGHGERGMQAAEAVAAERQQQAAAAQAAAAAKAERKQAAAAAAASTQQQ